MAGGKGIHRESLTVAAAKGRTGKPKHRRALEQHCLEESSYIWCSEESFKGNEQAQEDDS
ncbi:hypothetical protein E2562_029370 [Oryza meyeriana var. granulata]|uniref:Uncharacterized protein n=1 Tax=Oryza meyeriana var. granulata TaxID=110450 RepID=A0A6G1C874_9ORYZ|nr:hypothetical protein E2562_029370 [Oryza meyeriana var. granulata]